MTMIVEPDVQSLIRRLALLASPVQVRLGKLDQPLGTLLEECRKRKITLIRNGPGLWTFNPPPERRSAIAIVICRAVCLASLLAAILGSPLLRALWIRLEDRLKDYGLFTNLLASVIFGVGLYLGRRYIGRFLKAFLGLREERVDAA